MSHQERAPTLTIEEDVALLDTTNGPLRLAHRPLWKKYIPVELLWRVENHLEHDAVPPTPRLCKERFAKALLRSVNERIRVDATV